MTTSEIASLTVAFGGLVVSLLTFVRASQWRRQGTDEGLRQRLTEETTALHRKIDSEIAILRQRVEAELVILKQRMEAEHLKQAITEARLKPFFDSLDRRIGDMFHQPHDWAELMDHLIEKYRSQKELVTDPELQHLIDHVYAWKERVKPGSDGYDPAEYLAASIYMGLMDGEREARRLMREYEQRRSELAGMVSHRRSGLAPDIHPPAAPETRETWWTHLQKYLGSLRWPSR